MGPIHLNGKMVIISNDFCSEASEQMLLKFHVGQGNERLLKWSWFQKDDCHAHISTKIAKIMVLR